MFSTDKLKKEKSFFAKFFNLSKIEFMSSLNLKFKKVGETSIRCGLKILVHIYFSRLFISTVRHWVHYSECKCASYKSTSAHSNNEYFPIFSFVKHIDQPLDLFQIKRIHEILDTLDDLLGSCCCNCYCNCTLHSLFRRSRAGCLGAHE